MVYGMRPTDISHPHHVSRTSKKSRAPPLGLKDHLENDRTRHDAA